MGASNRDTVALYVDMEHRYFYEEMKAVAICSQILGAEVISTRILRGLGDNEDSTAYIHHRNAYLCLAASQYLTGDGTIYLTVQKDELDASDRTQDFLDKMSFLLSSLSGRQIAVVTPWATTDKTGMVQWYLENGGSKDFLKATWSCYSPVNSIPCGNCPACFRRWVAYTLNGIKEDYAQDPSRSLTAGVYEKRALSGEYSDFRCHRILDALTVGRTI
jgi:7-cyano-7-deazaguanine synthase in queuosine biosynthesis